MEGIYKITNKLNGKSYIGQSVHCSNVSMNIVKVANSLTILFNLKALKILPLKY